MLMQNRMFTLEPNRCNASTRGILNAPGHPADLGDKRLNRSIAAGRADAGGGRSTPRGSPREAPVIPFLRRGDRVGAPPDVRLCAPAGWWGDRSVLSGKHASGTPLD